jgi:hypothetical protein
MSQNKQHAAILRRMAEAWVNKFNAPALLAGAEALEAVEVAKAALREIAAGIDCGCVPCTGQCRSQSALSVELEVRQDVAIAALARLEGK